MDAAAEVSTGEPQQAFSDDEPATPARKAGPRFIPVGDYFVDTTGSSPLHKIAGDQPGSSFLIIKAYVLAVVRLRYDAQVSERVWRSNGCRRAQLHADTPLGVDRIADVAQRQFLAPASHQEPARQKHLTKMAAEPWATNAAGRAGLHNRLQRS
jgi:hypothetical protein